VPIKNASAYDNYYFLSIHWLGVYQVAPSIPLVFLPPD